MKQFRINRRTALCKLYGFRYVLEFDAGVADYDRLRIKQWGYDKLGLPHSIHWGNTLNADGAEWYYGPASPYSTTPKKDKIWIAFRDERHQFLAMMI